MRSQGKLLPQNQRNRQVDRCRGSQFTRVETPEETSVGTNARVGKPEL